MKLSQTPCQTSHRRCELLSPSSFPSSKITSCFLFLPPFFPLLITVRTLRAAEETLIGAFGPYLSRYFSEKSTIVCKVCVRGWRAGCWDSHIPLTTHRASVSLYSTGSQGGRTSVSQSQARSPLPQTAVLCVSVFTAHKLFHIQSVCLSTCSRQMFFVLNWLNCIRKWICGYFSWCVR